MFSSTEEKAEELNENGRFNEHCFYYPTVRYNDTEWFVMRRMKKSEIHTSVYVNGNISLLEQ